MWLQMVHIVHGDNTREQLCHSEMLERMAQFAPRAPGEKPEFGALRPPRQASRRHQPSLGPDVAPRSIRSPINLLEAPFNLLILAFPAHRVNPILQEPPTVV